MNIAVRYQSRGGNTKAVAEAIANAAGVKAEPISVPLDGPIDTLFVGGGVYKWGIDDELKDYLNKLNPATVTSVAAFSTAGVMDGTDKIISIAKGKGITVCGETLPVKVGVRNHAWFGGKGYIILSDKQINSAGNFVKQIIK